MTASLVEGSRLEVSLVEGILCLEGHTEERVWPAVGSPDSGYFDCVAVCYPILRYAVLPA